MEKEREQRKKGSGDQARCSTTDPDARKMKMGNGGFRPGYNVQLASDGQSQMIVGVGLSRGLASTLLYALSFNNIRGTGTLARPLHLKDCLKDFSSLIGTVCIHYRPH